MIGLLVLVGGGELIAIVTVLAYVVAHQQRQLVVLLEQHESWRERAMAADVGIAVLRERIDDLERT